MEYKRMKIICLSDIHFRESNPVNRIDNYLDTLCGKLRQIEDTIFELNDIRKSGEKVAVVIAETTEAAELGRKAIDVVYDDLPVIDDLHQALEPGAVITSNPADSAGFFVAGVTTRPRGLPTR